MISRIFLTFKLMIKMTLKYDYYRNNENRIILFFKTRNSNTLQNKARNSEVYRKFHFYLFKERV